MTTPSPTVIQADREAAANYMAAVSVLKGEYDPVSMAFMDPACDDLPIVQAFAAHRELGERRGRIGDNDLKDFGK